MSPAVVGSYPQRVTSDHFREVADVLINVIALDATAAACAKLAVRLEVRYSATPDAHALDETHKQVDTRTRDHPTDLTGLGDAAFWIGAPNNVTLFVFL